MFLNPVQEGVISEQVVRRHVEEENEISRKKLNQDRKKGLRE